MLAWIVEAEKHVGLSEIPGPRHNSTIAGWLQRLNAWWNDDETPWCGTFVAHCLQWCGMPIPKLWMRAKAWLDWGIDVHYPRVGCIVVFDRNGGGHVGFVVGMDERGNLMVLGGNQGNKVSVAPFSRDRVLGYRWPERIPIPAMDQLPILASGGQKLSENEA